MERRATCHCGALAIRCTGEPAKVSLCHCLDCQRRTGSLFSVAAFFPRDCVRTGTGDATSFTRPSASGHDVTFHFCPKCGSTVWWEAARLPHLIGVGAGTFADPAFPVPAQSVWAQDQHHWLDLPPAIASHAQNPANSLPKS